MDGFGTVANVITLVSTAMRLYKHIGASRSFEQIAGLYSAMIIFEYFRFETWAEQSGYLEILSHEETSARGTVATAELSLQSQNPISDYHLRMAGKASELVAQLTLVLVELDDLLQRYNITNKGDNSPLDPTAIGNSIGKLTKDELLARVLPSQKSKNAISTALSDIMRLRSRLSKETGRLTKIKFGWSITHETSDRDKISGLTEQLRYWNDGLRELLPPKDQTFNSVVTQARVLGVTQTPDDLKGIENACSSCTTGDDSDELYKDIRTGARMKYDRLAVDASQVEHASLVGPGMAIDQTALSNPRSSHGAAIETSLITLSIGEDGPSKAILETVDLSNLENKNDTHVVLQRIQELVSLLGEKERPASLIVPVALGYVQKGQVEFSLIYQIPPFAESSASYQTLYTLYPRNQRSVGSHVHAPVFPSLEHRFRLAQALCIGVLQLHSIRWLHKNLSSDSILMFSSVSGPQTSNPVMSGFGLGRAADPTTATIDLRAVKPEFAIYQHPELRDGPHRRYEQRHDIFSLGMLLFEIGLWQNLHYFAGETLSAEEFRRHIRNICQTILAHTMGRRYCNAVLLCIDDDDVWKTAAADSKDGFDATAELLSWKVVQELSLPIT